MSEFLRTWKPSVRSTVHSRPSSFFLRSGGSHRYVLANQALDSDPPRPYITTSKWDVFGWVWTRRPAVHHRHSHGRGYQEKGNAVEEKFQCHEQKDDQVYMLFAGSSMPISTA